LTSVSHDTNETDVIPDNRDRRYLWEWYHTWQLWHTIHMRMMSHLTSVTHNTY